MRNKDAPQENTTGSHVYNLDKIFTFPNFVNIAAVVFSIVSLVFNRIDIALISLAIGLALNTALGYRYHYEFLQLKEDQFKEDLRNTYEKSMKDIDRILKDIQEKLEDIEEVLRQKPVIKRTNRHKMYQLATDLVKNAQNRLLVVQRTPSLYFEPKAPGNITEQNFKRLLEEAKLKAKAGQLEFIYAFSIYDNMFKEELVERAKEQFSKNIEKKKEEINHIDVTNNEELSRLKEKLNIIKEEVFKDISDIIKLIVDAFNEINNIIEGAEDTSYKYEPKLYIVSLGRENHPQPLIISDNTIAVWITDIETEKLYIKTFDYDGSSRIFDFYKNIAENFVPAEASIYLKHEVLPQIRRILEQYAEEEFKKLIEELKPNQD